MYDLSLADKVVGVYTNDGCMVKSQILANNVITVFGQKFFSSEICIRTDQYVRQVFSHYYSDKSFAYLMDDILRMRQMGVEYYNPFTKATSRSDKEKNRKQNALIRQTVGNAVIPRYEREEIAPHVKLMREREICPAGTPWWMRNRLY